MLDAKWIEEQASALVDAGDDPLDATDWATQAARWIPKGEDPETFVPFLGGEGGQVTIADIIDARADWYANDDVPPEYKRLLDATETEGT
jgi:hypothetical protein